jgi:hypothetical protein
MYRASAPKPLQAVVTHLREPLAQRVQVNRLVGGEAREVAHGYAC